MGRLRQTALRWSRAGVALPRPLYPSRRHLQSSIARLRRRHRHVPLEGLCSRKHTTHDDCFHRRVYSPVLDACAPEKFCPHPALWLHGQLPTFDIVRTLPTAVGNGAEASRTGNGFHDFGMVVPCLSDSTDPRRETDCSSNRLETHIEMLCRYVVEKTPNRIVDVPLHADVDVCPHPSRPSPSRLAFHPQSIKTHDSPSSTRLRRRLPGTAAPLSVPTSTVISLLSP